jgi:hypothetical protein
MWTAQVQVARITTFIEEIMELETWRKLKIETLDQNQ